MPSRSRKPMNRGGRPHARVRPCLAPLEPRLVPATYRFPEIGGIAFDASGDVFVSYDSTTRTSGQQQAVAEVNANGNLVSAGVFGTAGASALPGQMATVGSSATLPSAAAGNILELQPNGQLFLFNPVTGANSQYDDVATDPLTASDAYDIQTGTPVDLTGQVSLGGATFGDFGIYQNDLVVSAESNNWDLVLRVTYGPSGGSATVLAASPASDGRSASPGGVAVDSAGTVLATLPYVPAGSITAIHVPVGFGIAYDSGAGPAPILPALGLSSVPNIDSGGIAVDSQDNFILAAKDSSLYGGGQGIVHINGALTAFLADPTTDAQAIPSAIACASVGGTSELAFTDANSETYTVAGELALFSGQVSPAQLRAAYGIDQITFRGPGGATVAGDGTGQTIAIVEEGVDPTLAADLATFDRFFGIPAPPSVQVVDQNNDTTPNLDIVGEASLDVEWAHAIAPGASIVVYNAAYDPNDARASFVNLMTAMKQASLLPGVSVVSLSYGLAESSFASLGVGQSSFESDFTTPGVTFVVAAGDSGIYGNGGNQVAADYPAASPNVLAVGGTSITIDANGDYPGTGASGEVAWGAGTLSGSDGGGGGGLSAVSPEPSWQVGVVPSSMDPYGARALPDVSMDSGAAQEYDVFASTLSGSSVSASAVGWLGDAGTSGAAPIWAGLIAIADQGRALAGGTPLTGGTQTLPALYSLPSSDYHDIVHGNNGDPARSGYDLATGLGTPVANLLVPALAGYQLPGSLTIQSEPPLSVAAGDPFGLIVQVDDSTGHPVSGGTVTVALASNPGGARLFGRLTVPVVNGVATFSNLTLSQPGSGYTLQVTAGSAAAAETTTPIDVTPGRIATEVVVSSSPTAPVYGRAVTLIAEVGVVSPATGTPGGTVTFEIGTTVLGTATLADGVAQLTTTLPAAGTATITAAYGGDTDDQPSDAPLTLTIGQATPIVQWSTPAPITAGTPLGSSQLDATASYNGTAVPGVFTYSPAAGTVLAAGSGRTLTVTFTPTDGADYRTVTTSVTIDVLPQSSPSPTPTPTPTQVVIIGEQPVFRRKVRKNGRPHGKPVLVGFTLEFSAPLTASAASNPANYELSTLHTKKAGKRITRVPRPVAGFRVSYSPGNDSVTIDLAGSPSFAAGGRLSVLPGVTDGSDGVLSGATVFSITKGGKGLVPS